MPILLDPAHRPGAFGQATTPAQAGVTTSYTLSVSGRRQESSTGPTGGAVTSTTTRHYTNNSDNPAWIDEDGAITRSTHSLAGDLGATIAADGTASLPLASLHGDTVTDVTIPGAQGESTACTTIGPWSDYFEYGTPRDVAATTSVGGAAGYGWLGAKERSTTTEAAGLTLMGERLYNPTAGRFASTDPIPGGNPTAYTYPTDPVNNNADLTGNCQGYTAACIRKILTSAEGYPTGFTNYLRSHGNWAYYRKTRAGWRKMQLHGDHCSPPARSTGPYWDFTNACDTHDLGYELLRFMGRNGRPAVLDGRRMVDSLFLNDMRADCHHRSVIPRNYCYSMARNYWWTINRRSSLQHYGVPGL